MESRENHPGKRPARRGGGGGGGGRGGGGRSGGPGSRPRPGPIGLRPLGGSGEFELRHPRCVEESELDYQEGLELWKEGDPEGARDALRFALEACHHNLWVHVALGRLALEEFNDPRLARGHYGYAVELGNKALPANFTGRLPRNRPANEPFLDALTGLAICLSQLGDQTGAAELTEFTNRLTRSGAKPPWRPSGNRPGPSPGGSAREENDA